MVADNITHTMKNVCNNLLAQLFFGRRVTRWIRLSTLWISVPAVHESYHFLGNKVLTAMFREYQCCNLSFEFQFFVYFIFLLFCIFFFRSNWAVFWCFDILISNFKAGDLNPDAVLNEASKCYFKTDHRSILGTARETVLKMQGGGQQGLRGESLLKSESSVFWVLVFFLFKLFSTVIDILHHPSVLFNFKLCITTMRLADNLKRYDF